MWKKGQTGGLTFDSIAELVRDVTDMIQWIRVVIIVFEEVEDAEAEHFESDAHMSVVIEPVQHTDT